MAASAFHSRSDAAERPVSDAPRVAILGGGLAGLAAAAALAGERYSVDVYEARPFLGGRATSYRIPGSDEDIDNCQHILLRCCVNLLDFYRRLGSSSQVEFHRDIYFLEPGGRTSVLRAGMLPTPLHFAGAFVKLTFLSLSEKIAVARALLAIRKEYRTRQDLDTFTMLDWLKEKRQPPRAIERFWRQVLVSAVNEELDRMAARHGLQVFWQGFLAQADAYEMGVPAVPLAELYSERAWTRYPNVRFHFRTPVESLEPEIVAGGRRVEADAVISALPVEKLAALAPGLGIDYGAFAHSPITGIHLWFDRPVTSLPHGTLLDRTMQWFFNKDAGRYLMVVVSASRGLVEKGRQEVIDLALKDLSEFLPGMRGAVLQHAHVVKEVRATFSAVPGLENKRPSAVTGRHRFYLAGDWTRCGWPATMEGAVRSGYLAAEAVTRTLGQPSRFLLPDPA